MITLRALLAALFGSMARDEAQVDRAAVQAQAAPARVVEDAPVVPLVDPLTHDLEDFA